MAAALREYINVKPPSGNSAQVKAMRPLLLAQNRMGGAVTYFGQQIKDLSEVMSVHADIASALVIEEDTLLDEEHEHRKDLIKPLTPISPLVDKGRKKDEEAEVAQEDEEEDEEGDGKKVGEEIAEKEGKKMKWWERLLKGFAPIVNFITKAFTAFVTYKAFDWLSNPKNQKNAEIVLKAVSAIVGAAAKIGGFGVFQIMEGITRVFGTNPDSKGITKVFDKLFGVLQVFGGLGSLWAASRLLMPWKLVGDYKKMKKLGDTLRKIKNFFQRKPNIPKPPKPPKPNKPPKPRRKPNSLGDRLRRTRRTIQRNIGKKIKQVKNLKNNIVSTVKNAPNTLKNMKGNVMNFGKNLFNKGKNIYQGAKNFGMDVVEKGKNIYKGASEWASKNVNRMKNLATKVKGGVFDWGKKIGAKMNQLKEMVKNPKAMFKPVMERIKNTIKPIIEKNPNIKKVLSLKNAKTGLKNAKDFAIKNVKIAMKSKEMANLSKFLKEAKGRVKIGGIDKVIAAVLGLIDYGLGESPINAIVSATSGLLGYAAGFAIGSPFGGFPGFITGAAGGMAGEFIGAQLLRGLGKMPGFKKLTQVEDPLANAMGLSPRPILRDPDVEKKLENEEAYKEATAEFRNDEKDIKTNPLDKKIYSFGYMKPDDEKLYSLRELQTMSQAGDDNATEFLKTIGQASDSQGPGSSTWTKTTTLKQGDGSTITNTESVEMGRAAGGLVTPNQDTSKRIKGKPTVWNNLYTEMVNNIKNKESKVQPMTSMVKPKVDPKVTPKQVQSSPTSAINNKVNTLTSSSEEKVQRSKESTKQQMIMVMRQQIIRSVQAPPPKVISGSKSPSPLIT